jgi:hypothetical protein
LKYYKQLFFIDFKILENREKIENISSAIFNWFELLITSLYLKFLQHVRVL